MKATIYFYILSAMFLSFSGKPSQTKNPPGFSNELTPNGDGKNDVFVIERLDEYPDNELSVFSRWGEVVYKASPYNDNWTGNCSTCKKGAEKLPEGVYYYIFTDKQTGTAYKGYLNLMR